MSSGPTLVQGGRPVSTQMGHMANEATACGISLRNQGHTAAAATLIRIGRQLRYGVLDKK